MHSHDHEKGGHDHGHTHDHGPGSFGSAFAIGATLNSAFVAAEVIYGLAAHSIALIADAAHNLADVLGLLLAWGAAWLAGRRPTSRRTYGWGRSTILASLINAVVLLISVGAIAVEALRRFADPEPVSERTVMWVAAAGIVINGATALLFMRGRKGDLNVKGAFLHMAADAAVSFGVVVAAFLIQITGRLWLDPATSLAIIVVITIGTWSLLRDSVNLAMDAVPEGIVRQDVEDYLKRLPGVAAIHDLHIWGLSTTEVALTVHLERPEKTLDDDLLVRASGELREKFGIGHATIQLETGALAEACRLAPDHVV